MEQLTCIKCRKAMEWSRGVCKACHEDIMMADNFALKTLKKLEQWQKDRRRKLEEERDADHRKTT